MRRVISAPRSQRIRIRSHEACWPLTANSNMRPAFASNDPSGLKVRAV